MPTRKLVTSYEDDQKLFPDRWHKIALVAGGLFLLGILLLADNQWLTIANLTLVTIVGALGLTIVTGFTGQISMGHAAFLAIGAYTAGIGSSRFGLPFWLLLPVAGSLAALVGLAVGPFALRLKGLYLAIITMGLVFLVNHMLLSFPATIGGVSGLAVPTHLWFAPDAGETFLTGFSDTRQFALTFERKLYLLYLALAILAAWCATNIRRSNTGRAMAAIRDHDLAASIMGVPLARYKIIAFGLSSFFGGVAGAMFAFQQQFITIDPPFNLTMSIEYIAIIVIGGMGTVFGAVAGAVVFIVVEPASDWLTASLPLLGSLSSAQRSILFLSVLVCVFMIAEPLGLVGIWARIRRYFAMWPFRR